MEPGKIGDITGELTFGEPQKLQELPIKHDKIEEINYQVNMGKKFFDLLVKKCQYYNGKSVTVPETKVSLEPRFQTFGNLTYPQQID